jgi:guanine nucleotide-binding protein subunit alpha
VEEGEIDKQLKADAEKLNKEKKILILGWWSRSVNAPRLFNPSIYINLHLGSGESGKSTTMKQLRLMHSATFEKDELVDFKNVVNQNILVNLQSIVTGLEKDEISLCETNTALAESLMQIDPQDFYAKPFTTDLLHIVRTLSKNELVLNSIKTKVSKYNLDDSVK